MQLNAITVLITGQQRQHHRSTTGHARLANQAQFIGLLQLSGSQLPGRPQRTGTQLIRQAAGDTADLVIDSHHFLRHPIELQQALVRPLTLNATPDGVGGETAIAFVDKCALVALGTLGLRQAFEPVMSLVGHRRCGPDTEHNPGS